MRTRAVWLLFSLAAIGCGQTPSIFTPEERASIMAYWSQPDRYTIGLPSDVRERGAWQVRLTVSGSSWLWQYTRGKKTPPTQVAVVPETEEGRRAEDWVARRIARDRWLALRTAQDENERQLGVRLPLLDASFPTEEPPEPGPLPASLAPLGMPPRFAEACVPMEHRVSFEDLTLTYRDRHRPGSPRYAYYRFDQGVGDGGTAVKTMPAELLAKLFGQAGLTEGEAKVMRAVSLLEGGFDSVNTYDTGFVSIGFIQFACLREGGGSLGAMLRDYKRLNPAEFQSDFRRFGLDVTEDGKLAALDLTTGEERTGADAAAEIIEDKRLVAVFQRAGRLSEPFIAAQIRAAKSMYLPIEDTVTLSVDGRTLVGKVSDVVRSEAGLAVLMDRKVNTGRIDPLLQILTELANELKPANLADLAPYERLIVERCRYRKDYLLDAELGQPLPAPGRATAPASRGDKTGRASRSGGG